LTVEDLNSSNGTFLNGERVLGSEAVRPGDHLQVGPLTFVVEYELTQDGLDALFARSCAQAGGGALFEEESSEESSVEEPAPSSHQDATPVRASSWKTDKDVPIPLLNLDDDQEATPSDSDRRETSLAGENWHLPEGADLRDLLAKMDDPGKQPDRDD
jgi:hypothetical protein